MDGGRQSFIELLDEPKTSVLPRLRQCMQCHDGAGILSLGDVISPRGPLKSLQIRSKKDIVQATATAKQMDESWKLLQTAWGKPKP